ncbi:MAG TPA: outer membrane protein assembly factor BamE [Caulobacteraceae bacterium]|jgi:outer membrane protein assembly factor BamE (lipoprotein component of BamABCDE complex)
MFRKVAFLALATGLAAIGLAGCSATTSYQGFQSIDTKPTDVKVGQDTRSTVLAKLGTPSATSTFDKDVWFYISQLQNSTSFYHPKTMARSVVAIAFDHDTEQVKAVHNYTLADGRVIDYDWRETPTRGREMTILEQAIGTLGAGAVLPNDQDVTPGSHPDDQH